MCRGIRSITDGSANRPRQAARKEHLRRRTYKANVEGKGVVNQVKALRMVGVWLLAALALLAVSTASAMASEEHQNPEVTKKYRKIFHGCPTHNPMLKKISEEQAKGELVEEQSNEIICFVGITKGGKNGGFFTEGGITTPLSKKIILQGAALGRGIDAEGDTEFKVQPAENAATLEAPPLAIPKGLKLITPQIQEEAGWPAALKKIYKEKVEKRETQISATIELAGNRLFEEAEGINPNHLIEATGVAFELPLKVKLSGPFLYKVQKGADTCEIGSDEHPVVQHLTTGESNAPAPYESNSLTGNVGEISFADEYNVSIIKENKLVDATWPVETDAEGCGGSEYGPYVTSALDNVLHLPSPAGSNVTALSGTLYDASFMSIRQAQARNGE
jgi:hypothetical protein